MKNFKKNTQEDKIQLMHPQGKKMPRIDAIKYEIIRKAMLLLLKNKELTHTELFTALEKKLKSKLEGNVGWYAEAVKLHLEAEEKVERYGPKPQKYRLK